MIHVIGSGTVPDQNRDHPQLGRDKEVAGIILEHHRISRVDVCHAENRFEGRALGFRDVARILDPEDPVKPMAKAERG